MYYLFWNERLFFCICFFIILLSITLFLMLYLGLNWAKRGVVHYLLTLKDVFFVLIFFYLYDPFAPYFLVYFFSKRGIWNNNNLMSVY